jgi:hypothetical protein
MALTKQQLATNEEFFTKVAAISKKYVWPSYGLVYEIVDGSFMCPSKEAFDKLKANTPTSFHSKIKMIES